MERWPHLRGQWMASLALMIQDRETRKAGSLEDAERERCIFSQSLRNAALSKLWVSASEPCAGFWPPARCDNKPVLFQVRVPVYLLQQLMTQLSCSVETEETAPLMAEPCGRGRVLYTAIFWWQTAPPLPNASICSKLAELPCMRPSGYPAVWTQGQKYKATMYGKPGPSGAHGGSHILWVPLFSWHLVPAQQL